MSGLPSAGPSAGPVPKWPRGPELGRPKARSQEPPRTLHAGAGAQAPRPCPLPPGHQEAAGLEEKQLGHQLVPTWMPAPLAEAQPTTPQHRPQCRDGRSLTHPGHPCPAGDDPPASPFGQGSLCEGDTAPVTRTAAALFSRTRPRCPGPASASAAAVGTAARSSRTSRSSCLCPG